MIATGQPVKFLFDPKTHRFTTADKTGALAADIIMSAPVQPFVFEPDGSATSGAVGRGLNWIYVLIVVHWLNGRLSVDQAQTG